MSEKVLRGSIGSDVALQGSVSNSAALTGKVAEKSLIVGSVSNPEKIYGKSAYEVAVQNGFVGTETEWLASLKGETGYTPIKGVDYYTEADKRELITEVLNGLPRAEEVSV